MSMFIWKNLKRIFHIFCVLATIVTVYNCFYEYFLDKDVSLVTFQTFNDHPDHVYPSFTLGILNPFLASKLYPYGAGINDVSYRSFLTGRHEWDGRMANINYDRVTTDLNKHFLIYKEEGRKFETKKLKNFVDNPTERDEVYVSLRSPLIKCFTKDFLFVKKGRINSFRMWINSDVFPSGKRPEKKTDLEHLDFGGLYIYMHYPKQLMRKLARHLLQPSERKSNSSKYYGMKITVKSMETVKRRNRGSVPCVEGLPDDDKAFEENIITSSGCRPPYIISSSQVPNCSSQKELRKAYENWFKVIVQEKETEEYSLIPCQTVEAVTYRYDELELNQEDLTAWLDTPLNISVLTEISSAILFHVVFDLRHFKQFESIQAYSPQSLIGNAGMTKKYISVMHWGAPIWSRPPCPQI